MALVGLDKILVHTVKASVPSETIVQRSGCHAYSLLFFKVSEKAAFWSTDNDVEMPLLVVSSKSYEML